MKKPFFRAVALLLALLLAADSATVPTFSSPSKISVQHIDPSEALFQEEALANSALSAPILKKIRRFWTNAVAIPYNFRGKAEIRNLQAQVVELQIQKAELE